MFLLGQQQLLRGVRDGNRAVGLHVQAADVVLGEALGPNHHLVRVDDDVDANANPNPNANANANANANVGSGVPQANAQAHANTNMAPANTYADPQSKKYFEDVITGKVKVPAAGKWPLS